MPTPITAGPRRARRAAGAVLVAIAVAGCASDTTGGRFRIAGSLAEDLLPGTGRAPDACNEYHRSLRGRPPAEQRAQLARAYGIEVDAQRAARHVEALDNLCAPMPADG